MASASRSPSSIALRALWPPTATHDNAIGDGALPTDEAAPIRLIELEFQRANERSWHRAAFFSPDDDALVVEDLKSGFIDGGKSYTRNYRICNIIIYGNFLMLKNFNRTVINYE